MNDPVFVEAAQALGKRIATATGSTSDKMRYGFRLCLARQPRPTELRRLTSFYDQAKAEYIAKPDKAKEMAGTTSESVVGRASPPAASEKTEITDLAAWTAVGNVLLNLDETLMRP
jgi:hypothetical protein